MSVLIGHAGILYNAINGTFLDYTVETKLPGCAPCYYAWIEQAFFSGRTGVFFGLWWQKQTVKKVNTQLTLMRLETWMGIAVYGDSSDSQDKERERERSSLILSCQSYLVDFILLR